ncbi:hypothetical protein APHAL10511_006119 [Amanita phalloides]|nr:hypothetical protein APHAL10511_006119 [Amanita phalloides]
MADAVTSPGPDSGDLPSHAEHNAEIHAASESVNHGAISEDSDATSATDPKHSKSALAIQPSQEKTSSAPNTPLVKKIINSGTFGSGSVKPTPRPSAGATTKSAAALALKKSNSASAAVAVSKPTIASSRAPTAAPSASRRSSMAPAAKAGASAVTKATAPSSSSKSASTRPSVVSPSASVASLKSATAHRPRTSVSEGTKRMTPTSTRPVPTAAKTTMASKTAPPRSSNAGTVAKSSARGSIGSINEVKENGKDSEELRIKLKDVTGELVSKAQVVGDLENRIQQLQTSLADAQAEVQLRVTSVQDLEQANASLEAKYKSELEASSRQNDELNTSVTGRLTIVSEKVAVLQSAVQAKEELIESLNSQKSALENELLAVTQKLKIMHEAHVSATQSERQNLLKVEAELKLAIADIDALKLAHAETIEILGSKSRDLDNSVSRIEELEIQINGLKAEREEHANKVSELEVEILELKESQETLEDEREKVAVKVKNLEEHISTLIAACKQAEEDAFSKATDYEARVTELQSQQAQELQNAADEQSKVAASLENVQAQLQTAQREHEQAKKDIQAAEEVHSQMLKDMEGSSLEQSARLEEEIKKITIDLEGQEAKYNSRVDAIKAEHEKLLQDAFERAKMEAGKEHGLELQNLRASSNATIEQLRAANQATIEDLKAEHAATLESDLKAFAKQINNLNLELKATQDDLSKAKASLDAARTDVENLTKQRDEALAAAASPALASEQLEEIAQLTNKLSRSNDDLQAVTDVLSLTKASLSEMSDNHAKELEEAAKVRAEEATKLRAEHEAEVAVFATQKSELAIRVSDLDGELATLKASIASEHLKSNGVSVSHPPSPDSTGVTREELQRMHEAHNLKLYDLQAEHDSAIRVVQEELKAAQLKAEELQDEVSRKAMEIKYLEQDQEDSQEQISRLKEDVDTMAQRLEIPSN